MNHPTDDQLLLLAYGEVPRLELPAIEAHMAGCDSCRGRLGRVETARVALDGAMPSRRFSRGWVAAGLAAAAIIAAIVLTEGPPSRRANEGWRPTADWSATAGYVTGGRPMMEIDAQLTRLEQERYYGLPN